MDNQEAEHEATADEQLSDEPMAGAADDDSDAPVHLDQEGHTAEGTGAGDIRAENVTISQGGARDIDATTVSITQGGAAQVRAHEMSLSQGGVVMARADSLTVNDGGSAFAVMADEATLEEGGNVFLLVAGRVSGDARPVLDWRAALGLGAGAVAAWSVLRRILR